MEHPELTQVWHKEHNYLALCSVADEEALLALAEKAFREGLKVTMFREPDLNNRVTAMAIEPGDKTRKLCKNLPLTLSQ